MRLVIDANIMFAAFISSKGITRELLFSKNLELISPEFLLEEIEKYRSVIKEKTGCSEAELSIVLPIILSRITIISSIEYKSVRPRSKLISPDQNDSEYFAAALKFSCPIWSNDKRLKLQKEVKVLSTTELLKLF